MNLLKSAADFFLDQGHDVKIFFPEEYFTLGYNRESSDNFGYRIDSLADLLLLQQRDLIVITPRGV